MGHLVGQRLLARSYRVRYDVTSLASDVWQHDGERNSNLWEMWVKMSITSSHDSTITAYKLTTANSLKILLQKEPLITKVLWEKFQLYALHFQMKPCRSSDTQSNLKFQREIKRNPWFRWIKYEPIILAAQEVLPWLIDTSSELPPKPITSPCKSGKLRWDTLVAYVAMAILVMNGVEKNLYLGWMMITYVRSCLKHI